MSIKLYASMGRSTPSSSHGQNVAADEADGQYAGKIVTGDVKLNNLSGPISIAKGAG